MHAVALASALLRDAGFVHGFSTRWASPGGVEGPSPTADAHLAGFFAALDRPLASVVRVKQVHGAAVLRDPAPDFAVEADAIAFGPAAHAYTPVIRTADCVPVLLADAETGAVAAVHAGWRGVAQEVVRAAFGAMGAEGRTAIAAIGPCLCARCFEVGDEVVEAIVPVSEPAVADRALGPKPHVDLRRAVRAQLRALGLADERIEDVAGCTRCEPERFFSYRRDGANAGRQMAAIAPRPR